MILCIFRHDLNSYLLGQENSCKWDKPKHSLLPSLGISGTRWSTNFLVTLLFGKKWDGFTAVLSINSKSKTVKSLGPWCEASIRVAAVYLNATLRALKHRPRLLNWLKNNFKTKFQMIFWSLWSVFTKNHFAAQR